MTFEFIAIIVAGFFGGGIALILRHITRGRSPRWLIGTLAGASMLGMAIWNEYAWYPRLVEGMKDGEIIAQTFEGTSPFRPWAFFVPLVDRALVVDRRRAVKHPARPELTIVPVFRFERWADTRNILTAFDCAAGRRVDITRDVVFSDSGELQGGAWIGLPPDDPVLRAACDGG